jgi:ATP-dependent DNA helicase PIF1
LLAAVRTQGFIALATTSSGVAASILPGGRTAHFCFKIPLEIKESMQCNVSKESGLATLLRKAKIIIWDEAPMTHHFSIEAVDRVLQDLNLRTLPFDGKVVVIGGDFRK